MERNQITDYLETHLKSGHSEQDLRAHLLNNGWSAAAVEGAFSDYHQTFAAEPIMLKKTKKHRLRTMRSYKSRTLSWWQKILMILLLAGAFGAVGYLVYQQNYHKTPVAVAPPAPTYAERQASDAFIVASGVVQYANEHDHVLPTSLSVSPEGSVLLCGATCGNDATPLATLGVYKPTNITYRPYGAALVVPDRTVLYLVQGGKCNVKAGTIGEPDPRPQSMVVLYATTAATGVKQHCLQL